MCVYVGFFFFNDTATTEIYTLSLHDALPIWRERERETEKETDGEREMQTDRQTYRQTEGGGERESEREKIGRAHV